MKTICPAVRWGKWRDPNGWNPSLGDKLEKAVVDFPSSKREHMHYVALSRLRSMSGLHILNMNKKKIAVSKKVQEEMTRVRQKATLNSHIPFLYKDTSESFKILFQNVR